MVTVHLIPHSHQDAGWRKTVDEYYTGANRGQDQARVKSVFDGDIDELQKNSKRKFTAVDMKYFTMWYKRQNEDKKK